MISSALTLLALPTFAVIGGQERFSPRQLGAICIGIAGVLMLFGPVAVAGTLDLWEMRGSLDNLHRSISGVSA